MGPTLLILTDNDILCGQIAMCNNLPRPEMNSHEFSARKQNLCVLSSH